MSATSRGGFECLAVRHSTCWVSDRQRDRERRAAVRIVRSPDFAAVAIDDGTTDRKAHAQSIRLAGDEGIEDGLEFLRGNADAAVPHFDPVSYTHLRAH